MSKISKISKISNVFNIFQNIAIFSIPVCGCSLKSLQMVLQQQSMVLNQIAEKLDVTVQRPGLEFLPSQQPRMSILTPDGGLYPAGPDSLHGSIIGERPYRRSVRITVEKKERPPSTVL